MIGTNLLQLLAVIYKITQSKIIQQVSFLSSMDKINGIKFYQVPGI
jgi:hypothetical protein